VESLVAARAKAQALKTGNQVPAESPEPVFSPVEPEPRPVPELQPKPGIQRRTIRLAGAIPSEVWNRLGTKVLPKLRSGADLKVCIEFSVTVSSDMAPSFVAELQEILGDLGLTDKVRILVE
jgi:hypothetical protein